MSLKSYLRALLNTRTTRSEASNASKPSSVGIDISTGQYVAPADGYVVSRGSNALTSGSFVAVTNPWGLDAISTCSGEGQGQAVIAPVSKGQAVEVTIDLFGGGVCRFVKTLGGGG